MIAQERSRAASSASASNTLLVVVSLAGPRARPDRVVDHDDARAAPARRARPDRAAARRGRRRGARARRQQRRDRRARARAQHDGRADPEVPRRARSASCSRRSSRRRRRSTACPIRCSWSRSTASCATRTRRPRRSSRCAPRPARTRSRRSSPAMRSIVERMRQHVAARSRRVRAEGPRRGGQGRDRATASALLLPRAAPLYAEEGDVVGATIVFQDVTRLHRFEELRNDLVATVAHELRTPLTSLRMAVHLLAEETVGPLTAQAGRPRVRRARGVRSAAVDRRRAARPVADPGRSDRAADRAATIPRSWSREAIEAQRAAAAARAGHSCAPRCCPTCPRSPSIASASCSCSRT